jgi:hypothetical protein
LIQAALQANVLGWLGVVMIVGLATGLWLGRRRRSAPIIAILMGLCAAAATAVPPEFIPTADGPGFTSQTESVFVLVGAIIGLSTGVMSWRLKLVGLSTPAVVLLLQLISFGLGIWGVQLSVPHHHPGG